MRFPFSVVSALCIALMISACARVEPLHNVIEAPVITASAKTPTLARVRVAIIPACRQMNVGNRWFVDPKID